MKPARFPRHFRFAVTPFWSTAIEQPNRVECYRQSHHQNQPHFHPGSDFGEKHLDFSGCQHIRSAPAFCALADKPHRIAVKEFVPAGMIKQDRQDASNLCA